MIFLNHEIILKIIELFFKSNLMFPTLKISNLSLSNKPRMLADFLH